MRCGAFIQQWAEPEKKVYLQCLTKTILKLLPDAPGIDRVRTVPLCFILISLICLRFWLLQNCALHQSG